MQLPRLVAIAASSQPRRSSPRTRGAFSKSLRRAVRRNRSVVALTVLVAMVSSGTVAAATYLVLGTTNSAGATTTLSSATNAAVLSIRNTNSSGGSSAKGLSITVPAGRAPITVNSAAGKATNLNADRLDGRNSTAFGQVRDFAHSVNATSGGDYVQLVTLGGLTLHRRLYISADTVKCQLYLSSSAGGFWDGYVLSGNTSSATVLAEHGFTPTNLYPFGLAYANGASTMGQIVFVNSETKRAVTVTFSIYNYPENGGCIWQGTASTGV